MSLLFETAVLIETALQFEVDKLYAKSSFMKYMLIFYI